MFTTSEAAIAALGEQGDLDEGEESDSSYTSESSVTTTESLLTSIEADMKQYKYTSTNLTCSHRPIYSPRDIEPALLEYLEGYYLLVDASYKRNHNIRKIRSQIEGLKSTFFDNTVYFQHPTGHAICIILQHVENGRRLGWSNPLKFKLDFTLSTSTNTIVVTCTMKVPATQSEKIRSQMARLTDWSEDHLTSAGVFLAYEEEDEGRV
ncbi:hypothetical protein VNI00_013439 [Paramarasmius palmivorus]|uniref:Uncharacterized protein n=1 Tax=Paramarasmius palmivorus TaxID=297713 RepID=A0AAW0C1B2_9AGAR